MNLGFSFSTAPVQPAGPLSTMDQTVQLPSTPLGTNPVIARTAAIAAQIGVSVTFFSIVNVNRHFVARSAIISVVGRDDDTMDQKSAKSIIRKLKTEKTEPSNDQRPN